MLAISNGNNSIKFNNQHARQKHDTIVEIVVGGAIALGIFIILIYSIYRYRSKM